MQGPNQKRARSLREQEDFPKSGKENKLKKRSTKRSPPRTPPDDIDTGEDTDRDSEGFDEDDLALADDESDAEVPQATGRAKDKQQRITPRGGSRKAVLKESTKEAAVPGNTRRRAKKPHK